MPKLIILIASCLVLQEALGLRAKTRQTDDLRARIEKVDENFANFVSSNTRNYKSSEEYKQARLNFIRNNAKAESYNDKRQSEGEATMGVNKFSDMNKVQFEEYVKLNSQRNGFEKGLKHV